MQSDSFKKRMTSQGFNQRNDGIFVFNQSSSPNPCDVKHFLNESINSSIELNDLKKITVS